MCNILHVVCDLSIQNAHTLILAAGCHLSYCTIDCSSNTAFQRSNEELQQCVLSTSDGKDSVLLLSRRTGYID